jgi:hypothetical protein
MIPKCEDNYNRLALKGEHAELFGEGAFKLTRDGNKITVTRLAPLYALLLCYYYPKEVYVL